METSLCSWIFPLTVLLTVTALPLEASSLRNILNSNTVGGRTPPCHSYEFACASGEKCIYERWVCDTRDDCGDYSDEDPALCLNNTCAPYKEPCGDTGYCLYYDDFCDGVTSCPNGFDEKDCDKMPCNGKFQCANKKFIIRLWRCDYENDCGDYSDERGCIYSWCPYYAFKCDNQNCITPDFKCDGINDCGDLSDEKDCD